MHTLLKQQHLRWLGHVVRMADDQIPKDVGRISAGKLPQRETTAVIQGYLQAGSEGLRNAPQQMGNRRQAAQHGLSHFEETLVQQAKRQSRKQQNQGTGQGTDCTCLQCGSDCHS